MLGRHADEELRVYAIWQPMIPTDFVAPASSSLKRLPDRRVQQYWDPKHLVATRLKEDARPPQPEQDCCVRSGILWDLAAVYPAGASWSERMPPAIVFNGPVIDSTSAIEAALSGATTTGWLRRPESLDRVVHAVR